MPVPRKVPPQRRVRESAMQSDLEYVMQRKAESRRRIEAGYATTPPPTPEREVLPPPKSQADLAAHARRVGAARRRTDSGLEALVRDVRAARAAGSRVNLTALARAAGVSRQHLYDRVRRA